MNKKIVLLLGILFSATLFAGVEPVSQRIAGTAVTNGAIMMVQDDKWPTPVNPSSLVEDYPAYSRVTGSTGKILFGIDHGSDVYTSGSFKLKLDIKVTAYDKSGSALLSAAAKTLIIDYAVNAAHKDKDLLVVADAHKLVVEIVNICVLNSSDVCTADPIPSQIFLETEIETQRYYKLDVMTAFPVAGAGHRLTTSIVPCLTCAPNEAEIYWEPVQGAEEYELEWTYVNTYTSSGGLTKDDLEFDFKNNSTRVRVAQNSYKINLIYDKGWVVYRIRAVGRDLPTMNEVFSPWTLDYDYENHPIMLSGLSSYTCKIDLTAFNRDLNKNWQFSSSFAEDGKKKEVIAYFDGSLRNRQNVTKINTDDEAVVGETIYDYQGRPAVNILPVPVNNNEIRFYEGLNKQDGTSDQYNWESFDKDAGGSDCVQEVKALDDASGAANYYSSSQPSMTTGQQNFTPDAEKYPFTVTKYTPDNTGRIASQGGVGPLHQLGQKETKYIYGQPEQEQLDKLFGPEVGYYQHYKKNVVIDANGQASISYLDLSGKVIATSIAGQPANLVAATNNNITEEEFLVKYLDAAAPMTPSPNELQEGNILLFTKELVVPVENDYTFVYNVIPETFAPECLPEGVCYDCVYDLIISIKDACSNEMLPGGVPHTAHIGKTLEELTGETATDCIFTGTALGSYTVTLEDLPPGSYTISKSLIVSETAADIYVDNYMNATANDCVQTFEEFLASEAGPLNDEGCGITCEECSNSLGATYGDYTTAHTDPEARLTEAEWELEKEKCWEDCTPVSPCANLLEMMLADVRVGGQYATFEYDADGVPVQPNTYGNMLSVMQLYNYLGGSWRTPGVPVHISHLITDVDPTPCGGYFEDDGYTRTLVPLSAVGSGFSPAVTTAAGFNIVTTIPTGCTTAFVYKDVDGNYFTYPQYLGEFKDFIAQYLLHPSWAQSLVEFHPEFCYYKWCTNNENPDITYTPSGFSTMTSFDFDNLLAQTETYAQAVSSGLISTGSLNDAEDLADKDPYFNATSYPLSGQFYGPPQKTAFENSLNNYLVLDPPGTPNKTIKEAAAQAFACGGVFYGPTMISTACSQWSTVMTSGISTATKDKIWLLYRDNYLTQKQKMQRSGAHDYARDCSGNGGDCYNGHIGIKDAHFNPFAHDFIEFDMISFAPFGISFSFMVPKPGCKYFDVNQPGHVNRWWYYRNKIKRFPDPSQNVDDLGDPASIIAGMANVAGAGVYATTGQCPVASQLQGLLTEVASTGQLTVAPNTLDLSTVPAFTKKLYNQLIDASTHPNCPDWDAGNSFYNLFFNTTSTSTTLNIQFYSSTAVYKSAIALGSGNHVELTSGSAVTWADIDVFINMQYLSVSAGIRNFTIDAVDYGTGGPPVIHHLTGQTKIDLNDCNFGADFVDVCHPTELAVDMMNAVNAIVHNTGATGFTDVPMGSLGIETTNMQYYLGATNSLANIFTHSTLTTAWVYEFKIGTKKLQVILNPTATAVCTPAGSGFTATLGHTDFDEIDYFTNIRASSTPAATFMVDAWSDFVTAGVYKKYELDGIVLFIDNTDPPVPLDVLDCNSAVEEAICTEPENQVREDLAELLQSVFDNLNCPSSPCDPQDITMYPTFTDVLNAYLLPLGDSVETYVFTPIASGDSLVGNFYWKYDTLNSDYQCQLEMHYVNTSLTFSQLQAITQVDNFRADMTYADGTGISYHFLFEDQDGNTVAGSSCWPLRNCVVCMGEPFSHLTDFERLKEFSYDFTKDPAVNGFNLYANLAGGPLPLTTATYVNMACPNSNQFSVTKTPGIPDFNTLCNTTPNIPVCVTPPAGGCPFDQQGSYFTDVAIAVGTATPRNAFAQEISGIPPGQHMKLSVNYTSGIPYTSNEDLEIRLVINGHEVERSAYIDDGSWHFLNSTGSWFSDATTAVIQVDLINASAEGSDQHIFIALDDIRLYAENCAAEQVTIDGATPFPQTTYTDPCEQDLAELQATSYAGAYQEYLDDLREDIKKQYMDKCLSALENFTNQYIEKEFNYTLYYYDQAGNLIKTVPPDGVRPLSAIPVGTDPSELDVVKTDRANNTRTIFTKHVLATEYEYNSLNQLVKQKTPDNDALDIFAVAQSSGLPSGLVVNQIQLVPGSNEGFLFGTDGSSNGHIYTTSDGGQTWTELTSVGTKNLNRVQIIGVSGPAYAFAVGDDGTLLKATISGSGMSLSLSWSTIATGIASDLNDLYFVENVTYGTRGIMVGDNGTMVLYDNGSFTHIPASAFSYGDITGVSPNIAGSSFIAGISGKAFISIGSAASAKLYLTMDGGVSWTPQFSVKAPDLKRIFMETAATGYAVGVDGTLLKTTNAGMTWEHKATNLTTVIEDLYSAGTNMFAVLSTGSLFYSTDGGTTWTNTSAGSTFKALSFLDPTHGVAVGSGGLVKYTNDGSTWSAPGSGTTSYNFNAVHYFSSTLAYMGADQSGGGFIVDKLNPVTGAEGSPLPIEAPDLSEDVKRIVFEDADHATFVTQSGKVGRLVYDGTTDWTATIAVTPVGLDAYIDVVPHTQSGTDYHKAISKLGKISSYNILGASWASPASLLFASSDITSIASCPSGLLFTGDDGILLKYDGTAVYDYSKNTRPLPLADVKMSNSVTAWAVGQNGTLLKGTETSGVWNFVTLPLGQTQDFRTTVNTSTRAFAAGDGADIIEINISSSVVTTHTAAAAEDITDMNVSGNLVYFTGKNGYLLQRNTSLGSWSTPTTGLTGLSGFDLNGIFSWATDPVVVVGEGGTILKDVGGWTTGTWSYSTDINPPAINDAVMPDASTGYAVANGGYIYSTANGWISTTSYSPPSTGAGDDFNAVCYDPVLNQGFAVGDNGVNCDLASVSSPAVSPNAAVSGTPQLNDVATNGSIVVTVGNAGVALKRTLPATSWGPFPGSLPGTAPDLNAVYVQDDNIYIAGDGGYIAYSLNGGTSWNGGLITVTTEDLNDIYFVDSYTGYAVGENGVMVKTVDGGLTWTVETTGIPGTADLTVIAPGTGYHFALGTTGTTYNMNDQNDLFSSLFFYDKLGRIVASQNSKQARIKTDSDNKRYVAFSYTKYDALGRIVEVGEMKKKNNMTATDPAPFQPDAAYLNNPVFPQPIADASHTYLAHEVTQTTYDSPALTSLYGFSQQNLRNRVSSVKLDDDGNGTPEYATFYSYDIHGNVQTLIQDNVLLGASYSSQRYKRIDYSYDLISGNVNQVSYQSKANLLGQYPLDRFFHKYEYDGDNRITNVYTSRDGILWDQDAKYYYYKHGPLARTELGDLKVQGTDYAYTLHGWIKSVNAGVLNSLHDMGVDGEQSGFQYSTTQTDIHKNVAKDAFGFNLHYFTNDYQAINTGGSVPAHLPTITGAYASASNDLYNGNIGKMITAIKNTTSVGGNLPVQGTAYIYDQLNRIKEMNAFRNMSGANDLIASSNSFSGATNDGSYHEEFSYDGNGNILTLNRTGNNNTAMDAFTYQYDWINPSDHTKGVKSNRLYHVNDPTSTSNFTIDIDDQGTFVPANPSTPGNINVDNNYGYDEIGNLVRDDAEEIANIEWNSKNKIKKIIRATSSSKVDLEFIYDPLGIRVAKISKPHGSSVENGGTDQPTQWTTTWYVHDGEANTMSVYSDQNDNDASGFYLNEFHIYGNSRMGTLNVFPKDVPNSSTGIDILSATYGDAYNYRLLGTKNYELTNHLSNVLAVVSDLKIPIASTVTPSQIEHYESDVVSATDYYSFGSPMCNRTSNGSSYRYGFNGQEKDNEVSINGGSYNAEFWQYDSRLGRRWNLDPVLKVHESSYATFANNPICFVDELGADSAERAKAVAKAQEYVDKNPNPSKSCYGWGSEADPGNPVDCQGLVDNCMREAGYEPHESGTTWYEGVDAGGVGYIVNSSIEVKHTEAKAGYAITFDSGDGYGRFNHVGIIKSVSTVGGKTKITFIHSGSSTGPTESSFVVGDGSYYDKIASGYWKWDSDNPKSQIERQLKQADRVIKQSQYLHNQNQKNIKETIEMYDDIWKAIQELDKKMGTKYGDMKPKDSTVAPIPAPAKITPNPIIYKPTM